MQESNNHKCCRSNGYNRYQQNGAGNRDADDDYYNFLIKFLYKRKEKEKPKIKKSFRDQTSNVSQRVRMRMRPAANASEKETQKHSGLAGERNRKIKYLYKRYNPRIFNYLLFNRRLATSYFIVRRNATNILFILFRWNALFNKYMSTEHGSVLDL